jgi:hypothetical protein
MVAVSGHQEPVTMSLAVTAAGMGASWAGPAGVLIPIGIEQVVSDLTTVTRLYNWFSISMVLLIGVTAGYRDSEMIGILMPLWAAFCMLAGWLQFPNPGTGFGILVVCVALAIMTYMNSKMHERFGIAGPGNKIIKITIGLIILQCVVAFVNPSAGFAGIFPDNTAVAPSNAQYGNVDLNTQISNINSAGGLTALGVDILSIATQMAYSLFLLLMKVLVSIGAFSLILNGVFPWIAASGQIGIAFLMMIQFAIWFMYLLFIFTLAYKPSPDPSW